MSIKFQSNMHIVFIASSASIHSIRWINYFVDKKIKISLISFNKANHITELELKKIKNKLNIYSFDNLKNIFRTVTFLVLGNYSLIHIHYLGWHSLLTIFKSQKSKLILTPWGSDLLINKTFFKETWFKILFRKADYLICDSERLKNESIRLGMKKEHTSISMFGVDTNIYSKTRQIFSERNIYFIGSNRNLESVYDVITFLKAAKSISEIRSDVFFLIAGDGSQKESFKNFVKHHKLSSHIKFLGSLDKEEMLEFYNKIDIYVSTSLSDGGLAASIAEAMSFERMIIISNNSDNKFWIKNKKNGYLFESKDHKSLTRLILQAIDQKGTSIKIAESSRDLIKNNYSYQKEMGKVIKKYKRILNQ